MTATTQDVTENTVLADGNPGLEPLSDSQPGLRVYLAHKRAALLARQAAAEANPPTEPGVLRASAEAVGRSGVRRIRIRDFQILSDSPEDFAGYELGPSSPELQLGVLSSCLTHTVEIHAASLQVPLDALRVEVVANVEPRRGKPGFEDAPIEPHNLTFTIHVESPASDAQIQELYDTVVRLCPILNLLRNPQVIAGSIVRDAAGA